MHACMSCVCCQVVINHIIMIQVAVPVEMSSVLCYTKDLSQCSITCPLHVCLCVNSCVVYSYAKELAGRTRGRLSLQTSLFLVTQQPTLLATPAAMLAARIGDIAQIFSITHNDMAGIMALNEELVNILPYRYCLSSPHMVGCFANCFVSQIAWNESATALQMAHGSCQQAQDSKMQLVLSRTYIQPTFEFNTPIIMQVA